MAADRSNSEREPVSDLSEGPRDNKIVCAECEARVPTQQ